MLGTPRRDDFGSTYNAAGIVVYSTRRAGEKHLTIEVLKRDRFIQLNI